MTTKWKRLFVPDYVASNFVHSFENGDFQIMETFSSYLLKKLPFLSKDNIKFQRFDKLWFNAYSPDENEWVKGCPDFVSSLTNRETRFLFIELKIKDDGIFRKTYKGGITKNGSIIPKYGCQSFYLDIIPVYRNMKDFCLKHYYLLVIF